MISQKILYTGDLSYDAITGDTVSGAILLDGAQSFSIQCVISVTTPAAKTFANTAVIVADNTVTITDHGFSEGLKVRLTTTGGLPAPLATATDYFVIVMDANTISFASSLANAVDRLAIDLTTQGTNPSTNTVTPTALADASVTLEKSNNAVTWDPYFDAEDITEDDDIWFEDSPVTPRYMRLNYSVSAGQITASNIVYVKGAAY